MCEGSLEFGPTAVQQPGLRGANHKIAGRFFFLGLGTSNPAVPLTACTELFTSGDLLTVPLTMDPHGVNGQARFFIPDVPLLLFTDVFAQALHFDAGSVPAWRASSGLHLRIGGRIQ